MRIVRNCFSYALGLYLCTHSIASHRTDNTNILRNFCDKHFVDVGLSSTMNTHTDWLTDITLPCPNSFLPFCAVKHISRSSEYIQIAGNQFIRHFLLFLGWAMEVESKNYSSIRCAHICMIYRFLRIFYKHYTIHTHTHTHTKKEENTLPGYHFWFNDNTSMEIEYSSNSLKYLFTYLEFST